MVNSFLSILSIMLVACNSTISSEKELLQWISMEKNGFVKEKTTGDITIRAKFLPTAFNVFREIDAGEIKGEKSVDSMIQMNQLNLSFLLTIRTKNESEDIMYKGISTPEEFDARAKELNFNLASYITLVVDGNEIQPVHAGMENTYSLSSYRNFLIIFSPQDDINQLGSAKEFTLIFDDQIFGTGINKFNFNRKNIYLPKIVWKNI